MANGLFTILPAWLKSRFFLSLRNHFSHVGGGEGQRKGGVRSLTAPVDSLLANWAYMVMGSLAWSLKAWAALILPENGRWQEKHREEKYKLLRMEFATFRHAIMNIPAQIVRTGGKIIYRLLAWNPWQHVLFAIVGGANLHDGPRQPQPRRAVVRSGGHDLAKERHAGAEIVLAERGVGVAADLRQRLGRRTCVRLDLRFQRDGALGKLAVLEGLLDGGARGLGYDERRDSQQRGGDAGAKQRDHRKTPPKCGKACNFAPLQHDPERPPSM